MGWGGSEGIAFWTVGKLGKGWYGEEVRALQSGLLANFLKTVF